MVQEQPIDIIPPEKIAFIAYNIGVAKAIIIIDRNTIETLLSIL
jgi:hypothetical protein